MGMPERVEPPIELPLLREVGEELHQLFLAEERADARLRARGVLPRRGFLAARAPWLAPAASPARERLPRPRRHLRVVVLVALALLAAAAVALAADGLLSGAPVTPRYPARPNTMDGTPIPASAVLLPLTVADPRGGLPWGLRVLQTTRGLGCLQYGRLYGGQLGVLGQDGAFGDDHRFHALSLLDAVSGNDACVPLDERGNLFLAVQSQALPASADPEACLPRVDYRRGARVPGGGVPLCPVGDERALFFGALGPDVKSISYSLRTHSETVQEQGRDRAFRTTRTTYALAGPTVTLSTVGRQGAYLIVASALPEAASQVFGPGAPNGTATLPQGRYQPIRAIAFRNGNVCHIGATRDLDSRGQPCTALGMVKRAALAPALARARLSARVLYDHRDPPLKPEDVIRVSFPAPLAIASASHDYELLMRYPCRGASGGSTTDENIAKGQQVIFELGANFGPPGAKPCPGVYSGEVLYAGRSTQLPPRGSGAVVGHFAVRLR
jgi:hypothetical protein